MKNFWDERFSKKEYAYGELPNEFLKQQLEGLSPGAILFPAEGEGRNAVYAASLGWKVDAFDASEDGKKKALALAEKQGVALFYEAKELREVQYQHNYFDAIGLIYAHFSGNLRQAYHRKLIHFLKPGGLVILEAFSQSHPPYQKKNPTVGGPLAIEMLFSKEDVASDFVGFDILQLSEEEIELNEGIHHVGLASVIRFVGRKR